MGKALYRKYRSRSLDEIVGQSHITDVLKNAIRQGRTAHAYLLTGPRGVGKTSIARILAHEINQLPYDENGTHLDIIEIDAASNNGVEDVRDLREKVQLAPISAQKKVYIIDEVHMLSKPAFNALLKTLEEPPEHIVFILATTDADKLPATIISRVQQFGFRAISEPDAVKHLAAIAKKEKIAIDTAALKLIAQRGDGSFRDSISLLDQLASIADEKTGITTELVERTLGLAPETLIQRLLDAHEHKQLEDIVQLLDEAHTLGIQATTLASQLTSQIRATLTSHPHYIGLLDQLLEVPSSSHPDLKLLTVLAAGATPTSKPKTAALEATAPAVVEAPIASLEKQAVQKTPKDPAPKLTQPPKTKKPVLGQPFDWQKFLDHTKKHHVAIYSVLVKCSHEFDGQTLTIYAVNGFYKKKLDDAKYRPQLAASLEAIGAGEIVIDTIPTTPPPKDEQAARVAAIMGGGEEVVIDSDGNE